MTALLDTNIIIDVLRRRNGRDLQLLQFLSQDNRPAVTSVVMTEVYMGAISPKQLQAAAGLLGSMHYFPVTPPCARLAGLLYSEWRAKGITLALPDVTIAAVCLENGIPLISDNTRHFPMPELKLVTLPFGG